MSLSGAGEASAARRRRQASVAARIEEGLRYCEELDAAGSVLARRALLVVGAPRSRAGALAVGSVHRHWYGPWFPRCLQPLYRHHSCLYVGQGTYLDG